MRLPPVRPNWRPAVGVARRAGQGAASPQGTGVAHTPGQGLRLRRRPCLRPPPRLITVPPLEPPSPSPARPFAAPRPWMWGVVESVPVRPGSRKEPWTVARCPSACWMKGLLCPSRSRCTTQEPVCIGSTRSPTTTRPPRRLEHHHFQSPNNRSPSHCKDSDGGVPGEASYGRMI